jgi:predicted metal-dependent TIM-barrel fold hydrolase
MTSLEGIDQLHMSGVRAVFRAADAPDEADIAAAFAANGMKLERFERERRPRARRIYVVDAGIT